MNASHQLARECEPLRLDLLTEICMLEFGMNRETAEAEVRRVCEELGETLTEVGHA